MNTATFAHKLSFKEFTLLGLEEFAYVRPVEENGNTGYGIFAADGTQVGAAPSAEVARAIIIQNDLEPMLVH